MSETTVLEDGLELKLELCEQLLKYARLLIGKAYPGAGVTIVVHDNSVELGQNEMAVLTTLPSRSHQRAVLTEAVLRMLLADGVDIDNAAQFAANELAGLERARNGG